MKLFIILFLLSSSLLFAKDKIPKHILEKYDSVDYWKEDKFLVVSKDGRYGYLDENYKEIIPLIYDSANFFRDGIAAVKLKGKWGAINPEGELVIPITYERGFGFRGNKAVVLLNGKEGIIDRENKVLVDFKYDEIRYSMEGGFHSVSVKEKYGYINDSGILVIPLLYDEASEFYEGLAVVKKGNTNFIIDKQNQITKELKYDSVNIRFYDHFFPVSSSGKFGLVNYKGDEIVQTLYDAIDPYLGREINYFRVISNGHDGFINENGKIMIPFIYESLSIFSQGLIRAKANGKYGFLNEAGKVVIPIIYDEANDYFSYSREGLSLAALRLENDYFIFDNKGNKITSLKKKFEVVGQIINISLIPVRKKEKWGYINYKGEIKIPLQFEEVKEFWYGIASVKIGGKWGFINTTGKLVIKPIYEEAEFFNQDITKVKLEGKYGIINRRNETIISFQYDEISSWEYKSNFDVTKDGRSYKINYNEEEIKEAETSKEE